MARANRTLTAIPGIRVGHWTDAAALTGCTAIVCDPPMVCGVDVRGGATGTRELELCRIPHTSAAINGLVLSGGSAYGLNAAGGVQREMEADGIGFAVGDGVVPLVPSAIIYDLFVGNGSVRPGIEEGAAAYRDATNRPVARGNVGAGTGATVGKFFGRERAMKGGLGSSAVQVDELIVAALVVVNAIGDVRDPANGQLVAGLRRESGRGFADTTKLLRSQLLPERPPAGTNTVIGCVATNARIDKETALLLARAGSTAIARCCTPAHTLSDGDVVFGLGKYDANVSAHSVQLCSLATDAMSNAILDGVRRATTADGIPAVK